MDMFRERNVEQFNFEAASRRVNEGSALERVCMDFRKNVDHVSLGRLVKKC